jgi:2,5-diamino-6-(ribosylamino)-4(3H)-pyrimidinone 5'-phosphate reductase
MSLKVILHNSISLDGRNEGFIPDLSVHYELVSKLGYDFDIHLTGSGTILAQEDQIKPEPKKGFKPQDIHPEDKRPILVIPDSKGRIRSWYMLRQEPYWRDCIALCTTETPSDFLEYLNERYIEYIVAGSENVDFKLAFKELEKRYNAKTILLDSGGILNGVLLQKGLVSEISLLVHPVVVGGNGHNSVVKLLDNETLVGKVQIKLINLGQKKDDLIWLQYKVIKN